MNQQEQARIKVLNSVLEHHLPIAQAAEIMGISERHTKRLLAAYRRDGPAAVAHGNRGRRPHNAVPEAAAAAVVKLASNGYAGANHTHLTELLRERESIDLSRPTVRRILTKAGIGSPRSRRSQQHRFRRRRMPQEGMLVQIDGSNHPWLEDRGPKLTLLIAVDDATGTVAQAVFRTSEDTRGYLVLLEGLIRQWAIPLALYSDRHAAFKYNARQKPVPVETTHQFARVMRELGIQQIFALSPQAKGRVERMLETFQDRLVTELRLASASTIDQAKEVLQEFLPKINARFAVPAEHPETAYRPVPAQLSLNRDHLHQGHPQGGPGQHGEVPLAGPAVAARGGTAQLRRTKSGRPGTGRRGADDQGPGRGRRLSGGTAALLSAVGRSQRLLPRPGTAGGRRWGGQQPSERGSAGTPGRS